MPVQDSSAVTLQPLETQQPNVSLALEYDIAIVGGGIVGLTLACALKESGLKIALIEAQAQSVAAAKGQVYNLSPLSQQIFQALGVWAEIAPQVAVYREIALSDAASSQSVRFYPTDLGVEQGPQILGHVGEHAVLLDALQHSLQASPQVDRLCPATVLQVDYAADSARVEVQIEGQIRSLQTQLVIAADGVRSPLRQLAGIPIRGWKYWQSCVVAFVESEKGHHNVAYERFWPSGPFAILPLVDGRCRIVWTAPHAEAQALLQLDETAFMVELQRRYGDQMGTLSLVGDRFLFPVQLQQSARYTRSRLALIGDAAHSCHPVGGQGMNLGIRDAAALAEVILSAHQQGEDFGSLAVLKRYERWRQPENLLMLAFTDFLVRCFSNNWLPLVIVRRSGLWAMSKLPVLRKLALRLMTGLNGRIPKLAQDPS
jgi:2-octaprenyl-6-methoxyphenol hydroxylase